MQKQVHWRKKMKSFYLYYNNNYQKIIIINICLVYADVNIVLKLNVLEPEECCEMITIYVPKMSLSSTWQQI